MMRSLAKRRPSTAALEHHGDAGLEQLGRVAVVDDLDAGAVVRDDEAHAVVGLADRPATTVPSIRNRRCRGRALSATASSAVRK